MSRVVTIVQARMTSTRLPGKVLLPLGGKPMLERQLERLALCREVDEIVLATTSNTTDDALEALGRTQGVRVFRGSEHDVLERYCGAAREARAEIVMRVTSDCPFIDPGVCDAVIEALKQQGTDYASNTLRRTYPRGLDTEVFYADTLFRMARLGTSLPAREHVTYFAHAEAPHLFLLRAVVDPSGRDEHLRRWTVDTPEDMEAMRLLFELSGAAERAVTYDDLLSVSASNPDIARINSHVAQKAF